MILNKKIYLRVCIIALIIILTVSNIIFIKATYTNYKNAIGEKKLSTLIIVKALRHFREGNTNTAYLLLETTVDMNVAYIWEHSHIDESTSNILRHIRYYREKYPFYSNYLQEVNDPVLQDRNNKANMILFRSNHD